MALSVYRVLKLIHSDGAVKAWHGLCGDDTSPASLNHFFDQLYKEGYITREAGLTVLTDEGRGYIKSR